MPSSQAGRPSSTLHYAVGEIGGKLDLLMSTLVPQLGQLRHDHDMLRDRVDTFVPRADIEATNQSFDIRIKANENFRFQVLGGAGVIAFIVTAWEIIQVFIPASLIHHIPGH